MRGMFPAVRCPCALLSLLWLNAAGFTQDGPTSGGEHQRDEQKIDRALVQRGSVDFVETPLREVIADIGRQFQIPIVVSLKKLEEASVSPDTPITIRLNDLSLESILGIILEPLELSFTVRHEVLLITTHEDVESQLYTRIYPVLDLVYSRKAGSTSFVGGDYDSLIEIITTTIKPDSWDDVGGPGAIDQSDNAGSLVVSQTLAVHKQIERLLTSLRRAKFVQGIPSLSLPTVVSRPSASGKVPGSRHHDSPPHEQAWQLPRIHD